MFENFKRVCEKSIFDPVHSEKLTFLKKSWFAFGAHRDPLDQMFFVPYKQSSFAKVILSIHSIRAVMDGYKKYFNKIKNTVSKGATKRSQEVHIVHINLQLKSDVS